MIQQIGKLKGTFSGLLLMLVVLLLIQPLIKGFAFRSIIIDTAFTFIFATTLLGLCAKKRFFPFALMLALPGLFSRWLLYGTGNVGGITLFGQLADFAFLTFSAVLIVFHVLRIRGVSFDTIAGAISAYMLVGVAFARLYSAIAHIDPGSFNYANGLVGESVEDNLLYYSFVTLTTLGFGDITPIGSFARVLTVLEAVVGQMFIAILIARLVASASSVVVENEDGEE